MDASDIRHNPHPKQAYEITVSIEDAPGPFDSVEGVMSFEVTNPECVPVDPVSGARKVPTSFPKLALTSLGHGRYTGTVYLDLLQDGNYFGLGICRWRLQDFVVSFNANGVSFDADILHDQIRAEGAETQFMSKELYQGSNVKNLNVGGVPLSGYIAAHREKFFSITLNAKERHDGQHLE